MANSVNLIDQEPVGDKPLGVPIKIMLIRLIEMEKLIINVGGAILWAWTVDLAWRRKPAEQERSSLFAS